MKVLYINNDGGGFADQIDIEPGTTVQALFDRRVTGQSRDYLIPRQSTTDDGESRAA